jgi:serine/threonine protein phosphatase PrpC
MTMPAGAAPAEPPEEPNGWLVLTASERGAAHLALQTPNQDSVAVERAGLTGVVAAIADGHGHSRHLRSARGSKLAASIGCRVAQELADKLGLDQPGEGEAGEADVSRSAQQIAEQVEDFLVPAVVRQWREAVAADVAADPFTSKEEGKRRKGDDPTIAYGSTLLLCLALGDWLILVQIGDGDTVGVRPDGTVTLPIPIDPQLDGMVTTSLCGANAIADFRVAVLDTREQPLLAVLLATDGYGNAQVVEEWPGSFSQDLAWLLREKDVRWLAAQLPSWAARCASADGSADDTTVALLISPAGQAASAGGRDVADAEPELGSDETTIPAVIHADTVPSQSPTATVPVTPSAPGSAPATLPASGQEGSEDR